MLAEQRKDVELRSHGVRDLTVVKQPKCQNRQRFLDSAYAFVDDSG